MMDRQPTKAARRAQQVRLHCRVRAGVSLLEVLFSIGVVMIGLVGIGALIPVGGALARKGADADASAQLAANAAREFAAREMTNPHRWRWYDGSNFVSVVVPGTDFPRPGTSFCLDPYFVSQAGSPAELAARNQFPLNGVYDSSILTMPRITLAVSPAPGAGALTSILAQQLFVSNDDLAFDLPRDRTLPPVQTFSYQNGAPLIPLKRTTQGNLSWMATIVPKLDRGTTTFGGSLVPVPTDEYTLSVIVFARRQVDLPFGFPNPASENDASERVVLAAAFYSGAPAFSGGDITLAARAGRDASDLELRNGDWVMFSGLKSLVPNGTVQVHKWYRVVNSGEDPVYDDPQYESSPVNDRWTREVTVVGPDWDTLNIPITQVTIVRGVVEVLEKTIRLETSSMWSDQLSP